MSIFAMQRDKRKICIWQKEVVVRGELLQQMYSVASYTLLLSGRKLGKMTSSTLASLSTSPSPLVVSGGRCKERKGGAAIRKCRRGTVELQSRGELAGYQLPLTRREDTQLGRVFLVLA